MLFCPELLRSSDSFASVTSYKDSVHRRQEMADVFNWMLSRSEESTIVASTDASNPKIRYQLQSILFQQQKDEAEHLENHIIYSGLPSRGDTRFPSRKFFGGLSTLETVVGTLPVSRVRMKTRTRDNFAALGETNTQTGSYSGVFWRGLSDLPRLALGDKDGSTGVDSPTYDDAVQKECKTRGYLFLWKETLDVEWCVAYFKDLNVTHV